MKKLVFVSEDFTLKSYSTMLFYAIIHNHNELRFLACMLQPS